MYAFLADHVSYGFGFLWLAGCALLVAFCVGRVLGDTMARADKGEPVVKTEAETVPTKAT
jgi:hypothetical protein